MSVSSSSSAPNRLIRETSPYLLQHAHNPVGWYPWGQEAFDRAEEEEKPVFLSIGYSACHWCHVMERESFEDAETADILNRAFIPVKVDREERPDIDDLYMRACQALTGSGGWPLSAFLTPDKKPFFAGTYFPRENLRGQIGFKTLLLRLEELWRNGRGQLARTAESVLAALEEGFEDGGESELPYGLAQKTADKLLQTFDPAHGGFGGAPKFPSGHTLLFLMRTGRNEPVHSPVWQAVSKTLEQMARGGLRDHLGGGFCRYSTDKKWLVPHFEKMTYDNALLMMAYTERFEKAEDPLCFEIVRETADFMLQEMSDPKTGLFYTALDADSENTEGKYYTFTPEEVDAALGGDAEHFCALFDIRPGGHLEGRSVPNLLKSPNVGLFDPALAPLQARMLAFRSRRKAPLRDEKALLTSNGLMIAALAKAARVFQSMAYRKAAARAAQSVLLHMRVMDGDRLFGVWTDGRAGQPATLDGYAYLIWGLLELYHTDGGDAWLEEAHRLAEAAMELFSGENGGLYYTGRDVSDLPFRSINAEDSAVPSGQSVMAHNLIRLGRLLHRDGLETQAQALIGSLAPAAAETPRAFLFLLSAHDCLTDGGVHVSLSQGEGAAELMGALNRYAPYMTVRYAPEDKIPAPGGMAFAEPVNGRAAAYVCGGKTCHPPVTSARELRELLDR